MDEPRDASGAESIEEFDAVVVGAGFAGLYLIQKLRELGLSVVVLELADDIGGTWYWNSYPGARCDVESMQYSYSFSPELQDDWVWTERYASQPEILRYINHVADRFDLRRDVRLSTRVTSAIFDEESATWTIGTENGGRLRGRFCIMATGCLSASRLPDFSGLDSFQGRWFHTGQWPKEEISFHGRRVGVIGTGSSGIQVIPMVAEQASQLHVFQRTANFSIPAWNRPLEADEIGRWKENYDTLRDTARGSRSGILYEYATRGTFEVSEADRQREYDRRWQMGGGNFNHAYNDVFVDKRANDLAADYVRNRIRGIVEDQATAERLCPNDHPIGTKRICIDTNYYATYNRPNVSLVSLRATPIEAIEPQGLRTTDRFYPLNDLIFATGYDAFTGALLRIDIRGRGGSKLSDSWSEGPRTYLGLMTAGFPNLFMVTGPGSPSVLANVIMSIEQHVDWICDCLREMEQNGLTVIEPTQEAEESWVNELVRVAAPTLFPTTASWYTGANVPGKKRMMFPYVGGFGAYTQICDNTAKDGYRGFVFT